MKTNSNSNSNSNFQCKEVAKLAVSEYRSEAVCPTATQKATQKATNYRYYSPKVRQQIMSNKLLNSQLYRLYTVRKLHCMGKWIKDNIVDGTIKIAKQTYIISWSDILPIDAYKEDEVIVSLRTPKYKDKNTKEYSLSYAVVSKFSE